MRRFAEIVFAAPEPITVLELGACDGRDTRQMANVLTDSGKRFYLFAFEPDRRRRERFQQQTSGLKVELIPSAIGATVGPVPFWISGGEYIGSSSLHAPAKVSEQPGISFEKSETYCVTLDRFTAANDIDRIEFIWSDIQGAEADMIIGGRETLKRTRWLYTEADGGEYEGDVGESEICAMLPGWENCGRLDGNLLLYNPDET